VTVKEENLLANTEAAPIEPDALPLDPALPGTTLLHQPMRLLETLSHVLVQWLGPDANLLDSRVAIRRIVPGQPRNNRITLVVSIGLALVIGANIVKAERAPPGSVLHVAAVGDIHDEGASSVAVATAAEAAKADFILGLGDYQYDDGAMSKYNSYFDKDWGPNVPKMYPVLAPNHDQFWKNADPLRYFNGGGAHGYKSPITLQPYTPYSFDKGGWHFIALPDTCARTGGCSVSNITSWLQQDLDTHTNRCTIAYWHQPYFTSASEHRPEASIKPWVDLLVAKHVDIVLQGHNHLYERFALQNSARQADPNGPQAFVVGTGGRHLDRFKDTAPNSVTRNNRTYGVLQLTLKDGSYDWQFVPVAGGTYTDSGSMNCR